MQAPALQPLLGTRMEFRQSWCRVNQDLVLLLEEQGRLLRGPIPTAQSSENLGCPLLICPTLTSRLVAFAAARRAVNALCPMLAALIAFMQDQTSASRQP